MTSHSKFMVDVIENKTVFGNADLLSESTGVSDERPFDPQVWFENNYQPLAGGEYIGPSNKEDLDTFRHRSVWDRTFAEAAKGRFPPNLWVPTR